MSQDNLKAALEYLGDVFKEACYKAAAILDGAEFDDQGRELAAPREEVQPSQSKPRFAGGNNQSSATPAKPKFGGGAGKGVAPDPDDPEVRFGLSKGKKVSQLKPKDAAWYAKVTWEDINDPEKAQYKAQREAFLDAILKHFPELATEG